jgi:hypothetical protein
MSSWSRRVKRDNTMMLKKLGMSVVVTVFTIMMVTPSVAFALAPSPPSIFIQASPSSQDVSTGGSTTFSIDVVPQGEWDTGEVSFDITGLPTGVTATVESNPATVTVAGATLTMTVDAAADAAEGSATLKITANGVASDGTKSSSDASVTLNVKAGSTPITPPNNKTTTSTTTSNVTAPVSTTTVYSTTSVVSTVTKTSTEVITTHTSEISTKTAVSGFAQASDLTLPATALVVVVALLAVAALALRKR